MTHKNKKDTRGTPKETKLNKRFKKGGRKCLKALIVLAERFKSQTFQRAHMIFTKASNQKQHLLAPPITVGTANRRQSHDLANGTPGETR